MLLERILFRPNPCEAQLWKIWIPVNTGVSVLKGSHDKLSVPKLAVHSFHLVVIVIALKSDMGIPSVGNVRFAIERPTTYVGSTAG